MLESSPRMISGALGETLGTSVPLKPLQKTQLGSGLHKRLSPGIIHRRSFKHQQDMLL